MLIKNAEALERFEKVDTIVVDKTGTLTEGRPEVAAVQPVPGQSEAELPRLAASLERGSQHPLGSAIVAAANERAAATMAASSVSLIANALRLNRVDLWGGEARAATLSGA